MSIENLKSGLIALIGAAVSLALGLGFIGNETAQIIVSTAGTVISLAVALLMELHLSTRVKAAAATGDTVTLRAIAGPGKGS